MKYARTLFAALVALGLSSLYFSAQAGLVTQSGPRYFASSSSSSSSSGGGARTVGDEYFVADVTDSANNYGFTSPYSFVSPSTSGDITITENASGGPGDRPYLRMTIDDVTWDEAGAVFPINPSTPTVGYGDVFYIRFSARVLGHYNQTQKVLQWNTLTGGQRVVIVLQPWEDGYVWRLAEDGGLWCQTDGGSQASPGDGWSGGTGEQLINTWYNVQIQVTFNSGAATSDGAIKIWLNNDTFASPTAQCSGFDNIIPDLDAGTMDWWGYHQGNVNSQLPRSWDWTDLRIGPTFDSSWHASGS